MGGCGSKDNVANVKSIRMKKVFVTGGNSGIGLALVEQLATDFKCYVFMGSRSIERGQAAIDGLPDGCKGKIEIVQLDISNSDSVKAAVTTMQGKLGGEKLFALVNNAGAGGAQGVPARR